jgi:ferric-dicitrate binding protein FerR (iron transport regulator)
LKTHHHIEELINRFLSGEVTEQEAKEMQVWLKESKENRKLFAGYKKLWIESSIPSRFDADQLKREKQKVDLKIRNAELNKKLEKSKFYIRTLAYAASILLLFGITSTFVFVTERDGTAKIADTFSNTLEVPYGAKSKITLPDGSKVWINAGSRITYKGGFGTTAREIELEGEAYFDVAKNEKLPFYVNTSLLKIKVYGTTFNVKAYADDDMVETTLNSGAISVISDLIDGEITMKPKQKLTVHRHKGPAMEVPVEKEEAVDIPEEISVEEVKNIDPITAWRDNRLIFEREPLWLLAKQLERRYNVTVVFTNEEIKTRTYTAALKEMPIDQVLEAITLTSPNISYAIKGTEVTISGKKSFKKMNREK